MLFVFSFIGMVKAQNDTSVWRDDMNYSSFESVPSGRMVVTAIQQESALAVPE